MLSFCPSCNNEGYWIETQRVPVPHELSAGILGIKQYVAVSKCKILCDCEAARLLKLKSQTLFESLQPGDVIRSLQSYAQLIVTHKPEDSDGFIRATRTGEIRHLRLKDLIIEDWVLWKRVGYLDEDAPVPTPLEVDFNCPVALRDGRTGLVVLIDGDDDDIDEKFRNRVGVQVPGEPDIRWIPNNQLLNIGGGAIVQLPEE
jgi:hypothetical protein